MSDTKPCVAGYNNFNKPIAQTLFLGASVADFSTNLGWGSQASTLNVSLVRDISYDSTGYNRPDNTDCKFGHQFPEGGNGGPLHHYHNTGSAGDSLYAMDKNGDIIKSKMTGQKVLRGKVKYKWSSAQQKFVSTYWTQPDPGFFGASNNWTSGGSFPGTNRGRDFNWTDNDGYDIIGVPVYFRMLDFEFLGLVKNWNYTDGSGGQNITVQVESPVSLLSNSYVVAHGFGGAAGLYNTATNLNQPQNFRADNSPNAQIADNEYNSNIVSGTVHNFFNAYGFLEAYGGFGASGKNERGTPAYKILDALHVLTSSNNPTTKEVNQFSPFGRIVSKNIHSLKDYKYPVPNSDFYDFGLVPSAQFMQPNGHPLYRYRLDASELNPPTDLRIESPILSIMDLLSQIAEATGKDFFIDCIPDGTSSGGGALDMFLKVRTIERLKQPGLNQIKNSINSLISSGAFTDIDGVPSVSDINYGQESNESVHRKVIVGGQQQRLFQAKNYRLAYTQNTFRLNFLGSTPTIVDYTKYNKSTFKTPDVNSTRNINMTNDFTAADVPAGSVITAAEYNIILGNLRNYERRIKENTDNGNNFNSTERVFSDEPQLFSNPLGGTLLGNYLSTNQSYYTVGGQNVLPTPSHSPTTPRFTPLHLDIISPFFGYRFEEASGGDTDGLSDETRKKPRTVFMDNFTGQICVICDIADLKGLRYGLGSLYGNGQFVITETEMRAAMAGFDNLVLYYTYKMFKSDLFLMLRKAFNSNTRNAFKQNGPAVGIMPFGMLDDEEMSGPEGQPAEPEPEGGDSTDQGANSIVYSKAFTTDLQIIHNFLNQLAGKYYGKSYMVRLPSISGYRDWDSGQTISLGNDRKGNPIKMWKGPPKSITSYEIASDGAWEEFGNVIDEDIVIGTADSYRLMDETGKMQPILGYNAQQNFDTVAKYMCANQASIFNTSGGNNVRVNKGFNVFGLTTYSLLADQFGDFDCDNSLFYYPALDYSPITGSNFVFVKEDNRQTKGLLPGDPVNTSDKLYITGTVRPKMVFEQPQGFVNPRAILESPGMFMNSSSLSHTQDMNRALNANIALEDLTQILYTFPAFSRDDSIVKALYYRVCSINNGKFIRKKSKETQSNEMIDIAPKAAHPFFAAIPLKSNTHTYGPWSNLPYYSKDVIIQDGAFDKINYIDNMVNGLVVEKDDELVPWNYGGTSVLDKAALLKVNDGLKYQSVAESASFTVVGAPKFGLGAKLVSTYDTGGTINFGLQPFSRRTETLTLKTTTYTTVLLDYAYKDNLEPTISNMQLKIGSGGLSTTYNLKLYSKPMSRFNKDLSDRLKKGATDSFKAARKNAEINNKSQSQILSLNQEAVSRTAGGGTDPFSASSKKLLGWSPSSVLMAQGTYYLSGPNRKRNKAIANSTDETNDSAPENPDNDSGEEEQPDDPNNTDPSSQSVNSAEFTIAQYNRKSYSASGASGYANNRKGYSQDINTYRSGSTYGKDKIQNEGELAFSMREVRHGAYVGLYPEKEIGLDINSDYSMKGVMSLDGIFSPISFYPTLYNSCYNLSKWNREKCPVCGGDKIYKDSIYVAGAEKEIYVYCKYCTDEVDEADNSNKDIPLTKVMEYKSRKSPLAPDGTFNPPFITVKEEDDEDVIKQMYFKDDKTGLAKIDTHSLQPILQESGDFLNPNSQPEDKGRHSISVVGRGTRQPDNKYELSINKNLEKTYFGTNPDFDGEKDVRLQDYLSKIPQKTKDSNSNWFKSREDYPLNNRYLGLRGPLVLHGWGYDLEGFPVPNKSDDAKYINSNGVAWRHIRKKNSDGDYINEDDYEENGGYPSTGQDMNKYGSIVSVTQEWLTFPDGVLRWTAKDKSEKFSLNWGERPDTWPVGPVDLRWDESRSVWTAPPPKIYKNVYVTLEEDLDFYSTNNPSRAFLTDYEAEIDLDDERKVVYVVDKTGYSAPSGSTLLCFYNSDSGFYEPIGKPIISAFGTIGTGNNVTLELSYITAKDKSRSSDVKSYNFNNPLGIYYHNGSKGLFNFIEGKWTLVNSS